MSDRTGTDPLARLDLTDRTVVLRRATRSDLGPLVALLADDPLGRDRDGAAGDDDLGPYVRAFEAIEADPAQLLVVAADPPGAANPAAGAGSPPVLATMQLSFVPGLSRRGMLRCQVEAVRVHADLRGSGLGRAMLGWAVEQARARGCGLVQLTTDKQRERAHRFYAGLGFVASHEGFKLSL